MIVSIPCSRYRYNVHRNTGTYAAEFAVYPDQALDCVNTQQHHCSRNVNDEYLCASLVSWLPPLTRSHILNA